MAKTFICSVHRVPCIWKEGGIKKDGTPYKGFYACPEKDPQGNFCHAPKIEGDNTPQAQPQQRYDPEDWLNKTPPKPGEKTPTQLAEEKDRRIAKEAAIHALSRVSEPRKDLIPAAKEMIAAAELLVDYYYDKPLPEEEEEIDFDALAKL